MEKKPITPVAAGLVIGLVSVVFFLGYYFSGIGFQQSWYSWIPTLVFALLIIAFTSIWSNAQNNFVTFGGCFGFAFRTVCVAVLISLFFTFLFIYFTPDYKSQMMQVMKEQSRQNKQATDEQIEQGMKMVEDHFYLIIIGGALFVSVLGGLIAALLGAAIAKKKPVSPFTNSNQLGEPES